MRNQPQNGGLKCLKCVGQNASENHCVAIPIENEMIHYDHDDVEDVDIPIYDELGNINEGDEALASIVMNTILAPKQDNTGSIEDDHVMDVPETITKLLKEEDVVFPQGLKTI